MQRHQNISFANIITHLHVRLVAEKLEKSKGWSTRWLHNGLVSVKYTFNPLAWTITKQTKTYTSNQLKACQSQRAKMKVSPDLKEVPWMEKTFLFKPGQLGSVAQSSLANLMIMVTMVGWLVHCLQCLVGSLLGWLPWLVHFSSELSSL